ncbi:MAG: polyprenyl diphosphate synthase [Candidatus Micrarchaeota archaeon]
MPSKHTVRHVAIIPDGNRRWAKKRGLDPLEGHRRGIDLMGEVLKWARAHQVRTVSFWAFSSENFNRDKEEVEGLFKAFETNLQKVLQEGDFDKYGVRVRFIGDIERFPPRIRQGVREVERKTAKHDKYFVNLFIGYGGRPELVHMARRVAKDFAFHPDKIDEQAVAERLWTSGVPDPDLIIRTSGEQRISGFMPFQSAYSELYFCQKLWPDFRKSDFSAALAEFRRRKRRWGK